MGSSQHSFTEKERHAIKLRLGVVSIADKANKRRFNKIFDILELDDIPDDNGAKLINPNAVWNPNPLNVSLDDSQRDDLIMWIEPTQNVVLSGFMTRLLTRAEERLVASRDKDAAEAEAKKNAASAP
jgi:hypothetical protein